MDSDSATKNTNEITLYRGFPSTNTYTWSPFVTKLEFRLRYNKIAYHNLEGSTREGPSGKVPYIDIAPLSTNQPSSDRELVGDSSVIIQTLIHRGAASDLNAGLSPEQKLADAGIRALCEEKLYFLGMSERWIENYYIQRDGILSSKPWILKVIIGNLIHRKIVQTVHLHGCGRFSFEEQKETRHEIWRSIEDALSRARSAFMAQHSTADTETPFWYFGRDQPSEADAVLFAFINSVLVTKSCPDSTRFVKGLLSTMDYAQRIHNWYFPDYEKWVV